ncbi:hypothetical protein Tsubulata_042387 [Turnera subulata]|uniref:KIB1-4 beta-propeller domain-containing protein n=1 Tax=Turnera subulata TaxID=218843 RepID=A0A9Q0FX98_9ROSI|nr:hypothetical protein Tsubulata_042387 [Turnera subulata]
MAYSSSYSLLRYSSCLRNLQYKTCNYHFLTNNNIIRKRTTAAAASSSSSYSSLSSPNPSTLPSSDEKPILSQFPLLILPSFTDQYPYDRKIHINRLASFRFFNPATNQFTGQRTSLLDKIVEFVGHPVFSNRGWLTYLDLKDCSLFLVNALSPSPSAPQEDIIALPSFKTFKPFDSEEIEEIWRYPDTVHLFVGKIALSSPPREDNCVVMLWLGDDLRVDHASEDGHYCRKYPRSEFAFCRIGDTRWTFVEREIKNDGYFHITGEIVYSNRDKLFYTLYNGELEAFDLNNISSPVSFKCPMEYPERYYLSEFEKDVCENDTCSKDYLVESPQGDLLRIRRNSVLLGKDGSILENDEEYHSQTRYSYGDRYRSVHFRAYKLNMEKQIAEDFNLEGMAVFVGKNQSFCVSVDDHPGLSPNSIYFTDDLDRSRFDYPDGGHDNGVYNLLTHTLSPLFQPFEFKRIKPVPMWVYPDHPSS